MVEALPDAPVAPRALLSPLPVWVGVGGTAESAARRNSGRG